MALNQDIGGLGKQTSVVLPLHIAGGSSAYTSVGGTATTGSNKGLMDISIEALMQSFPAAKPPLPQIQQQQVRDPQALSKLYMLCLQNGIPPPEFSFAEIRVQTFTVRLRIGADATEIALDDEDRTFPSKKAAKEAIAVKGLEWLSSQLQPFEKKEDQASPELNWVGRLLEFYQSLPGNNVQSPRWTEHSVGQAHSCECTIHHRPTQPFGGHHAVYPSKKKAKAMAAKEAWKWLESRGFVADGGGGGGNGE